MSRERCDLSGSERRPLQLLEDLLGRFRALAASAVAVLDIVDVVGLGSIHHIVDLRRVEVGVAHLRTVPYHGHEVVGAPKGSGDDGEKRNVAASDRHLARLLHHCALLVLEDLHDLLGDAAILEGRNLSIEELLEVAALGLLLGLVRELTLGLCHRVIELVRVGLSQEGDQLPDQLTCGELRRTIIRA